MKQLKPYLICIYIFIILVLTVMLYNAYSSFAMYNNLTTVTGNVENVTCIEEDTLFTCLARVEYECHNKTYYCQKRYVTGIPIIDGFNITLNINKNTCNIFNDAYDYKIIGSVCLTFFVLIMLLSLIIVFTLGFSSRGGYIILA